MADHAWCSDPSRDERVRAAEDGRDRPVPTLKEAIAAVTGTMSENGIGEEMEQGLRTERVTLEITHYLDDAGPASGWDWKDICQDWIGSPVESVRVVSDEEREAEVAKLRATLATLEPIATAHRAAIEAAEKFNADQAGKAVSDRSSVFRLIDAAEAGFSAGTGQAIRNAMERIVEERDAAIRERDTLRARVAELEAQATQLREAAAASSRLMYSANSDCIDAQDERDTLKARVAELESQLESVACRAATAETALAEIKSLDYTRAAVNGAAWQANKIAAKALEAASGGNSSAILTSSQAASGGGEGEPVAWREHVEQMIREWLSPTINELGDRATLEQFIGEEGIDSLIDFVCDERKGPSHPPQPRGWLTEEERGSIQHAATCAKSIWSYSLAQELENILARSTPPEVVLPEPPFARSNVAYSD